MEHKKKLFFVFVRIIPPAFLALFTVMLINDLITLYLYMPRSGCVIEVFDPHNILDTNNTCVRKKLTIEDYFNLDKTDSHTIVLVVHSFNSTHGYFFSTSEEFNALYPLLHPIKFIIGRVGYAGKLYMIYPTDLLERLKLDGKEVIIVSCRFEGYEKAIKYFEESGAKVKWLDNPTTLWSEELSKYS